MNVLEECHSTREKILQAALELFSEKGYLGATTKEIARVAGIAEVTLFRHFTTKEHLLQEVIKRYSFLPTLRELLPSVAALSYEEGLRKIAYEFLDTLVKLKDWIRIMHVELQRSPQGMHRIYHTFMDELFEGFAAYFRMMQEKGELRMFDPALGARAFHGIFFSYFNLEEVLQRRQHEPSEPGKAIDEFIRIFVHGTARRPDS